MINSVPTQKLKSTQYRQVPIDMQGFATNVRLVVEHKQIWMEGGGVYNDMAYIEASKFISQFLSHTTLECRTFNNEVIGHISDMRLLYLQSLA